MIETSTFFLLNAGFLPGITDECLYIISYGEPPCYLYVGQAIGKRGYSITCRLGRHFNANIDGCMKQNQRSGASRQLEIMFSKLSQEIQNNFTIILLNVSDTLAYVDLTKPEFRIKLIGAGILVDDIKNNNQTKQVINFCEKTLAQALNPTYCKAGYCQGSSGLPDELTKYLIQNS